MNIQHKNLSAGRWLQMPFLEQMANIGSEAGRALNWQDKNNTDYSLKAAERCLELIDLTLEGLKEFPRLKELSRLREIIADYFFGKNQFISTKGSLRSYFGHFAYAARKHL